MKLLKIIKAELQRPSKWDSGWRLVLCAVITMVIFVGAMFLLGKL